ncbi:MAG: DMT family transporter, partial [Asgard group archaeon]|nr:DMT family transporter [Asgard group archaeon]
TGIILSTFLLLQMYSVKFTTASASSFLLNVNPIITYLLAFLILKEEHQWWGFIGVIVSIGGVFLIAVPIDEIGNLFASQLFLGNIMAFLSGFAWAVYSIYIKRFLKKEDPVICTTWSIIVSTIILCIAMVIFEGGFPQNLNWVSTCLLLFMGIIPTAIAFTLWLYVIGKTPVQKLSVFQFLIPIIATLLAVLFLNETLNKFFYIGAGLIIIGLLITQKA